jgi:hypothetical protein
MLSPRYQHSVLFLAVETLQVVLEFELMLGHVAGAGAVLLQPLRLRDDIFNHSVRNTSRLCRYMYVSNSHTARWCKTQAVRGATDASHNLGDAVFQHADAIQHLSDALEEEVSLYARELGARIAMLHDGAHQITSAGRSALPDHTLTHPAAGCYAGGVDSLDGRWCARNSAKAHRACDAAGLAIARAGDRLASCGEHVALGMQQMVIVIAASMLTIVTGLFGAPHGTSSCCWSPLPHTLGCCWSALCTPACRRRLAEHLCEPQMHLADAVLWCLAVAGWRYLVLGCVVLWLCGFEVKHLQRNLLPGRRPQEHQEQHHVPPHSDGAHLPSALHNPAGIISPKRVSWEQGIDGSQARNNCWTICLRCTSRDASTVQATPSTTRAHGQSTCQEAS